MQPNCKTRVQKEFRDLQKNPDVKILMINENLFHWKATIAGAQDSPFEEGKFQIDIVIPNQYPYQPPKMKFDTKIWHPNVSSVTGAICLDILKSEWSPALSIRTALLSIQALMCAPEPDDPQDAEVAKQYKSDIEKYKLKAKEWTLKYANPSALENSKIKKLTEMGFTDEQARAALEKVGWDEEAAIVALLGA